MSEAKMFGSQGTPEQIKDAEKNMDNQQHLQSASREFTQDYFENTIIDTRKSETELALANILTEIENSLKITDVSLDKTPESYSEKGTVPAELVGKYQKELAKATKIHEKLMEVKKVLEQE